MVIESKLASGYWIRKFILAALCLVFGFWTAYDGWIAWPALRDQWNQYESAKVRHDELEAKKNRQGGVLTGNDLKEFDQFNQQYPNPADIESNKRTDTDIDFQRYILLPICTIFAVWVIVTWYLAARRHYAYDTENGSIESPEGRFAADDMTGIDMTRWMSKSIAMLEIKGGPKAPGGSAVKLDAWIYEGIEQVITELDKRFHPSEYAEEGGEGVESMDERAAGPKSASMQDDESGDAIDDLAEDAQPQAETTDADSPHDRVGGSSAGGIV